MCKKCIDEIREVLRRDDAARVKGTVEWFVHGPMLSLKKREQLKLELRHLLKQQARSQNPLRIQFPN